MKSALPRLTLLAAFLAGAAGAAAQETGVPAGNWQSVASETYTNPLHPVLTGAELYLAIDVAGDGSFRGEWREYFCTTSVGAYGIITASCRLESKSERVSGKFGPGRQGVIDLGGLGRGAFTWTAPAADQLAIDLPKNWQGDAKLWRARLWRDGKNKGATTTAAQGASAPGPPLSANLLYREFTKDSKAALARYAGRTVVLEGRRGTFIELTGGGAAIHIADGFTSRALVLIFPNLREVSGLSEGEQFRFTCTVESFDYLYVHLQECSIVR